MNSWWYLWYLTSSKKMTRELLFVIVIGFNLKRERMWMMHLVFHLVPKIWGIWGNVLIWRVSWVLGNFMEHFSILPLCLVWTFELAIRGQWHQDDEPLVIEAQFVCCVCLLLTLVGSGKACPEHIMLMISFSRFWSFLKKSGGGGCGDDDQFRLARFVSCCCCLSVWRAGGLCLEFAEQVRIVSCNLVLFWFFFFLGERLRIQDSVIFLLCCGDGDEYLEGVCSSDMASSYWHLLLLGVAHAPFPSSS
jgi:hypothetical protein